MGYLPHTELCSGMGSAHALRDYLSYAYRDVGITLLKLAKVVRGYLFLAAILAEKQIKRGDRGVSRVFPDFQVRGLFVYSRVPSIAFCVPTSSRIFACPALAGQARFSGKTLPLIYLKRIDSWSGHVPSFLSRATARIVGFLPFDHHCHLSS